MKNTRLWMMALPLALAACGGGDDNQGPAADSTAAVTASSDSATAAATQPAGDSAMGGAQGVGGGVAMNPVGNSGLSGQAQFMEHGQGQTMITITLNGQGNGPRAGHVHQGTCDNPGQVVAPLQDVVLANGTGTSTTTVSVPYPDVVNGQKIVAFHTGAGDNPGPPAVCAQIPAQQTGNTTGQGGQAM